MQDCYKSVSGNWETRAEDVIKNLVRIEEDFYLNNATI